MQATRSSVLMLLGGEPVGERFIEWNFVSSSKGRIAQAKEDWRAGRMKLPIWTMRSLFRYLAIRLRVRARCLKGSL